MVIRIRKDKEGFLNAEECLNFSKGGYAEVSVKCDENVSDIVFLRKESLSFLNRMASNQGMKVQIIDASQVSVAARVERGDSAKVKYLKYPIEILPDNKSD
jgi:hypothetical protein